MSHHCQIRVTSGETDTIKFVSKGQILDCSDPCFLATKTRRRDGRSQLLLGSICACQESPHALTSLPAPSLPNPRLLPLIPQASIPAEAKLPRAKSRAQVKTCTYAKRSAFVVGEGRVLEEPDGRQFGVLGGKSKGYCLGAVTLSKLKSRGRIRRGSSLATMPSTRLTSSPTRPTSSATSLPTRCRVVLRKPSTM